MTDQARTEAPLSVAEAATLVGVSRDTLKRGVPSSELPYHRTPGGHRRYQRSDVEAYIARRRAE